MTLDLLIKIMDVYILLKHDDGVQYIAVVLYVMLYSVLYTMLCSITQTCILTALKFLQERFVEFISWKLKFELNVI